MRRGPSRIVTIATEGLARPSVCDGERRVGGVDVSIRSMLRVGGDDGWGETRMELESLGGSAARSDTSVIDKRPSNKLAEIWPLTLPAVEHSARGFEFATRSSARRLVYTEWRELPAAWLTNKTAAHQNS